MAIIIPIGFTSRPILNLLTFFFHQIINHPISIFETHLAYVGMVKYTVGGDYKPTAYYCEPLWWVQLACRYSHSDHL